MARRAAPASESPGPFSVPAQAGHIPHRSDHDSSTPQLLNPDTGGQHDQRHHAALTTAEWHEALLGGTVDVGQGFLVEVEHDSQRLLVQPQSGGGVFEIGRPAALAAMSLRAGSGPILTWDHVRTLRHAADALPRGEAVRQGVLDVIDRIVALLPPSRT